MPLAVDGVYGGARALYLSDFKRRYRAKGDEKPLAGRLTLHSARLAIEVEGDEAPLVFEAELPADLARLLKALRKHAPPDYVR